MTANLDNQTRALIVSEALPYLRRFNGKTFVIKFGGASMRDSNLKQLVLRDVALLHYLGIRVVLVHGGGPEIDDLLRKLSIEPKFCNGLRVTDDQTMRAVEMVLAGSLQKELVKLLNLQGARAIGLTGADGQLLSATALDSPGWGWTGQITGVNTNILNLLSDNGYLPVISPIAPGSDEQNYNINADTVASELAIALNAEKLILLTDTPGLLENREDSGSIISRIDCHRIEQLIAEGKISDGMIPKVQGATYAIKRGVNSVHILDGRHPHVLLLEIFTEAGVGTMIHP